jgi:IMP and pyridine-specific 5'-nucleotidase
VKESGHGGWITATKFLQDSPGNWADSDIQSLLNVAEEAARCSLEDQQMRGRIIRKKRSVGLVPTSHQQIPREALDETVLRCQAQLQTMNNGSGPMIPFCAFNGGRDVWVDVGNKRVGVEVLSAYLGIDSKDILHIGDQFLNTGNDYAARDVCPCVWVTDPEETTYILKTILRFAGVRYKVNETERKEVAQILSGFTLPTSSYHVDFQEAERRTQAVQEMDVFTGEMK